MVVLRQCTPDKLLWSCLFITTQLLVQLLSSLLLSVEHSEVSFLNCPRYTLGSVPQTLSWSCSFIATQLVQLLPSGSVSQMLSWSCSFVTTQLLVQLLSLSLLSVEHLGVSFLNCLQFTVDTLPSSLPMVYLGQCLSDVVVELFIRRHSTSAAAPIITPRC